MARLGSRKHPAVVRVRTMEEAAEIVADCERRGWRVIAGVEPDQLPDISDYERLLRAEDTPVEAPPRTPRNAVCPCGSGRKYKRCCGQKRQLAG